MREGVRPVLYWTNPIKSIRGFTAVPLGSSGTLQSRRSPWNDAILPLLAQYKNPNDRQRINKLLKDNLKKAGVCSYEACEAINNWNDPAFEWYAKAACQATIKQEDYDAGDILQLLCAYPAPWSYQILKKLLTQKGDYSNSDIAKDYLTERYKTRPVPPIFKPLYDMYVARKK